MTDRVVLVEGVGSPGPNDVVKSTNADIAQAVPDSLNHIHSIRMAEGYLHLPVGLPRTNVITSDGIRFTVFRDFIGENVFFSVEIANAEWGHLHSGSVKGPREIPDFDIVQGSTLIYSSPQTLTGKILNPREHTFFTFATGPKKDAMQRFEHMVQCTGDYSYQNQDAWGPQESRVIIPVNDIPTTPFRAAPIANSPLTPMGFPDGNETGGALIEVAVLPGANDPNSIAWLFDVMKCIMDREPIWAFASDMGDFCDDRKMAEMYDGEIPYRAADTNRADKMMPEFFDDKWEDGHQPRTNHNYKAHDGQHFVRATCTPKSVFWNTGSMLAQHCIDQLSAHIRLCRTAYPVRNPGWGYEESVYDMLNRSKPEHRGVGRGVGRREDAWGMEVQVMALMMGNHVGTLNWLRSNAVVIADNILPTGVGAMTAPNVVWQFLSHYHAKPPMTDIEDGCGYHQTIEVCHYAHALFCLSRIQEFNSLASPLVVACSKLMATSHFKWEPGSATMGMPWYIQIRDPDGTIVTTITHGQGKYQENWNAMILHSHALRCNPSGQHAEFLRQMYGENLDQIPDNGGYEKGRVAMMLAAALWQSELEPDPIVIVDPEPDPIVTEPEPRTPAAQIIDLLIEVAYERNQKEEALQLLAARDKEVADLLEGASLHEQAMSEAWDKQQQAEDEIDGVRDELTDAVEAIGHERVLRKNAERELNILKASYERVEQGAAHAINEAKRWQDTNNNNISRIAAFMKTLS